ncbi:GNAT family N-acetyltransferase [Myxacorys almedinensis]|uniref:GNAT family N-acetyltransferase n=1 Tax=Myxacorys almedinensis A TaxID=2690445 RepID=A0A8J8CMD8_9CYAN|nr:GNAT family N-acetyltransferase [Myxacorys almedinensis]NDJ17147.1 GNAT family N-acetyltransferase [Myxacorys almedinensis A]
MTLTIRLLRENELIDAEQLVRLAFGTFVGLPNPDEMFGDAAYIPHRWKAEPASAFAAELDGKLVGINLARRWGSFGFVGPLTVHPELWNQGIAQKLLVPVMDYFQQLNVEQVGLFTFAASPKHHALYQKFGFWQHYLTCVMATPITPSSQVLEHARYSQLSERDRAAALTSCFEITNEIFAGLEVAIEINTVQAHNLGDTVLLWDKAELAGFAVCHAGAGTEAGSHRCYVKFAAVRLGARAGERFEQLLDLCEMLGATLGASSIVAGVNTSRNDAYRRMIARGYHTEITGVAMLNPLAPAFNRADVYVLDDWR